MSKLSYLGSDKPKNYYQTELDKIDQFNLINFQLSDSEGNKTKNICLNAASLAELENFLHSYKNYIQERYLGHEY